MVEILFSDKVNNIFESIKKKFESSIINNITEELKLSDVDQINTLYNCVEMTDKYIHNKVFLLMNKNKKCFNQFQKLLYYYNHLEKIFKSQDANLNNQNLYFKVRFIHFFGCVLITDNTICNAKFCEFITQFQVLFVFYTENDNLKRIELEELKTNEPNFDEIQTDKVSLI